MKIEVSEYYKNKGVKSVYVNMNKEPRRVALLVFNDGTKHSMSYAKYLYTSYYKCDISKGDEVDHIDNNQLNDVIENLQVISKKLNNAKKPIHKEMVLCKCPVCEQEFLFEKRNLSTHPNPCCSRKCGGIKSHWIKKK